MFDLIEENKYILVGTSEGKMDEELVLYLDSEHKIVFTYHEGDGKYYMYWNVKWVGPYCWACYIDRGDEETFSIIQLPEEFQ